MGTVNLHQTIINLADTYTPPLTLRTTKKSILRPAKNRWEKLAHKLKLHNLTIGYVECEEAYYENLGFGIREIKQLDKNGEEFEKQTLYFINQNVPLDYATKTLCPMFALPLGELGGEPVPGEKALQYLREKIE